jgi:hypothetical protein
MDIFDEVDGILTKLELPFFHDMPESAREPPDTFIVYSAYDMPSLRGDGDEIMTRYNFTFSIFGKDRKKSRQIYETLKPLLKNSGFCRSGTVYTSDNDFPKYYRITADFNIDL